MSSITSERGVYFWSIQLLKEHIHNCMKISTFSYRDKNSHSILWDLFRHPRYDCIIFHYFLRLVFRINPLTSAAKSNEKLGNTVVLILDTLLGGSLNNRFETYALFWLKIILGRQTHFLSKAQKNLVISIPSKSHKLNDIPFQKEASQRSSMHVA